MEASAEEVGATIERSLAFREDKTHRSWQLLSTNGAAIGQPRALRARASEPWDCCVPSIQGANSSQRLVMRLKSAARPASHANDDPGERFWSAMGTALSWVRALSLPSRPRARSLRLAATRASLSPGRWPSSVCPTSEQLRRKVNPNSNIALSDGERPVPVGAHHCPFPVSFTSTSGFGLIASGNHTFSSCVVLPSASCHFTHK